MKMQTSKFVLPEKWFRTFSLALAAACLGFSDSPAEISKFTPDGFAIPQPGRHFIFPRDYGSHPEFAIEWWYITGHLIAADQSQFGFQATFFRRALVPPGATNDSSSVFGNDQIYLAHMALVNKITGKFIFQERLNRDGWDADASTNTLDVRNGNWLLRLAAPKIGVPEVLELQASVGADVAFALNLIPKKPLVIFGTNGVHARRRIRARRVIT